MGTWPTDDLTKVHLDAATDDPSQARAELVALIDKVKVMIAGLETANTANAGVKRDSSGNFAAGTITAALSGNATTATTATSATTATNATTAANTSILGTVTSAEDSSGATVSSAAEVVDLDLGTVADGDVFLVNANVTITKGGTAGKTGMTVGIKSGTATATFTHDATYAGQTQNHIASIQGLFCFSSLLKVTGNGTLVLRIIGESLGSNGTIATGDADLAAVQLYNA